MSEKTELQQPAEKLLKQLNIRFVHVRNHYKSNTPKELKGFPDLEIYFHNGNNVFVEFKHPKIYYSNKKTLEKQAEWEVYLKEYGYTHYIIREFKDFERLVNKYRWTSDILKELG